MLLFNITTRFFFTFFSHQQATFLTVIENYGDFLLGLGFSTPVQANSSTIPNSRSLSASRLSSISTFSLLLVLG